MTALIRAYVALLVLLAGSVSVFAAEIRVGSAMTVKPNSIWFQDVAMLTHWQKLKKRGSAAALSVAIRSRSCTTATPAVPQSDRRRFSAIRRRANQVRVEMLTEGRMQGTHWVLDTGTLMQKPAH